MTIWKSGVSVDAMAKRIKALVATSTSIIIIAMWIRSTASSLMNQSVTNSTGTRFVQIWQPGNHARVCRESPAWQWGAGKVELAVASMRRAKLAWTLTQIA